MGKVVIFPKENRNSPSNVTSFEKIKESIPSAYTFRKILIFLFALIRFPIFLVMYWLRFPVVFICNLISIPMLFCWLFSLYAFPDKSEMIWTLGIISFAAFSLSWTYDFILVMLAPQDMIMTL